MNNIKYYWINIDNAIERKNFMEKQFEIRNINNKRISAITPSNLEDYIDDKPPYNCGYPDCKLNNFKDCPIEYSVLCSHLEAIKEGYKSGDDYFIICEDDIYFPYDIDFKKMIDNLPEDIDIIQMMVISYNHTEHFYNNYYKNNIHFIKYTPITPSAGFYLIKRKGAKKILNKYINNKTNKYNFTNCNYLKLADVLIYQSCNTCVSTIPFCIPNINFISQIHPHHYQDHKKAYDIINKLINENYSSNPFILKYYPFESFFNNS